MNHTTHILIDIEALGLRAGAAIIELSACAFCPETGKTGEVLELLIEPQFPFTADLDTLAWHAKKGSWPRFESGKAVHSIGAALVAFGDWVDSFGTLID